MINTQSHLLCTAIACQISISKVICVIKFTLITSNAQIEGCVVIMFKPTIKSYMLVYKRAM